jgi:SAM-dependent methyltransferase
LVTADGAHEYTIRGDVPDLRVPPERLRIDLPWVEPWDELDALDLNPPERVPDRDLPYHLEPEFAAAAGPKGNGRWIVEIGCGERHFERYFEPRGFRYVGTDVDQRGIGPHVLSDAHNLPFHDASFDLYTSHSVYEHLVAPIVAAQEAARVLKPGGLFLGNVAFVYGFHDRASFHHMSHAGLLWMLRSVGFERVRIWPTWYYTKAIPEMAFRGLPGLPWRKTAELTYGLLEWSFTSSSRLMRALVRKKQLDVAQRRAEIAGALAFIAHKSATAAGAVPAAAE